MAPTDVPTTRSGTMPRSARAASMPTWMAPRVAPPASTNAVWGALSRRSMTRSRCWPMPSLPGSLRTSAASACLFYRAPVCSRQRVLSPLRSVVAEGRVALLQRLGQALRQLLVDELLEALLFDAQRADLRAGADGRAEAHDLHRLVHRALVELGDVGRDQRDALGDPHHVLVELVDREGAVGPAEPHGLGARDRVPGHHHLHGRPHAQEPGVELHVGHAEAHGRV